MITKAMFKTREDMHKAEDKLVERVHILDRRFNHSGEFDEKIFGTAWHELMEFWRTKKAMAINNRLPKHEVIA